MNAVLNPSLQLCKICTPDREARSSASVAVRKSVRVLSLLRSDLRFGTPAACTRDSGRNPGARQDAIGVADHADHRDDADHDDQQGGQRAFLETAAGGELIDI